MSAREWSLQECIDYAIEHNVEVKSRRLSAQDGERAVTEARDQFLPELSGYAGQNFNFGRGLSADNTYVNRNTSSFSTGASLSLPIFQGLSAIRGVDYAKASLLALLEQTEVAKDNVELNVIGLYLQSLYASEQASLARLQVSISEKELARRRALFEAGRIPELDIAQAEAQLANDRLTLTNAQNDSTLALLDLAQTLNLDNGEVFGIQMLGDENLPIVNPEDVYRNALVRNHAMRAGQLQIDAANANMRVAQTGYIPKLSFSAGLGTNYYTTTGYDNGSFGTQMKQNFAKSIGFNLSIPIFDAFRTRNNISRARSSVTSAELQLEDQRQRLYKSISQAYTQAVAAAKKQESADIAATASKTAFEAMELKYNHGRANATEFDKAKADYLSALSQALQAKYEKILRARILSFYNKE